MRIWIFCVLIFLALLTIELLVNRLNPLVVHIPVILPLLLVAAVVLSHGARSWFRTTLILSIIGGLAGEVGSTLPPGAILGSYAMVAFITAAVARRFVAQLTPRIIASIIASSSLLTYLALTAVARPTLLQLQPLSLFFQIMIIRVVIPTGVATILGLIWQSLLSRDQVRRIAVLFLSRDLHG